MNVFEMNCVYENFILCLNIFIESMFEFSKGFLDVVKNVAVRSMYYV